jgi:hypothetical protein
MFATTSGSNSVKIVLNIPAAPIRKLLWALITKAFVTDVTELCSVVSERVTHTLAMKSKPEGGKIHGWEIL